jgi:hypothetical protein
MGHGGMAGCSGVGGAFRTIVERALPKNVRQDEAGGHRGGGETGRRGQVAGGFGFHGWILLEPGPVDFKVGHTAENPPAKRSRPFPGRTDRGSDG